MRAFVNRGMIVTALAALMLNGCASPAHVRSARPEEQLREEMALMDRPPPTRSTWGTRPEIKREILVATLTTLVLAGLLACYVGAIAHSPIVNWS